MNKEEEFSRFVHEQRTTIYTICYMFSKDNDEVQDLFQNILINLWKGYDTFRGESQLRTWVWRVALNTCPDFITLCCYIMAPIVFQLVTTIFWVVLGGASIKSVLLYYVYTQKT